MLEQAFCSMQALSEATAWRQEASQERTIPSTTEVVAQEGVQWVRIPMLRRFSREVESKGAAVARLRLSSIRAQACSTG